MGLAAIPRFARNGIAKIHFTVGHPTAAEPSIFVVGDRLGRRFLQKLTQERSQQKAATAAAKREFNPRTDLKVCHYKHNPKKKHIDRGWILEMRR